MPGVTAHLGRDIARREGYVAGESWHSLMDAEFTIFGKRWTASRISIAQILGSRPTRNGNAGFSIPTYTHLTLERLCYPAACPRTMYVYNGIPLVFTLGIALASPNTVDPYPAFTTSTPSDCYSRAQSLPIYGWLRFYSSITIASYDNIHSTRYMCSPRSSKLNPILGVVAI